MAISTPEKESFLKWWIAGLATLLLLISIIPIWSRYQNIGEIKPAYFTIEPDSTDTICISKEKLEDFSEFKSAILCEGGQVGSSVFGNYTIDGTCLNYTAKDSLGKDSICVELSTKMGVENTIQLFSLLFSKQNKTPLLKKRRNCLKMQSLYFPSKIILLKMIFALWQLRR